MRRIREEKSKLEKAIGMLVTWARAASDDEDYDDMVASTWELIDELQESTHAKVLRIEICDEKLQ